MNDDDARPMYTLICPDRTAIGGEATIGPLPEGDVLRAVAASELLGSKVTRDPFGVIYVHHAPRNVYVFVPIPPSE